MLQLPETYLPTDADDGIGRNALASAREVMATEREKLEANEATIAVIGAMKAGKSTIISAVVGSEVVPSREQPMTTFPTIVSHEPGLAEPVLTFPLAAAFMELAKGVAAALEAAPDDADQKIAKEAAGESLARLKAEIMNGQLLIPERAEGLAAVHAVLINVNDLTRLARLLYVPEDPVNAALQYANLPRINVDFVHLDRNEGAFAGKLSLVDTPGPDEAGNSAALERITRQQLASASAIILVIDYTKQGNEGDAKVNDLLEMLPPGAGERLFIMVNRYDSAQQHEDGLKVEQIAAADEKRVQALKTRVGLKIADILKRIDRNANAALLGSRTFPTIANMALLSNQARRALQHKQVLSPEQAWVQNFAKLALGAAYRRRLADLQDPDVIGPVIEDCWEQSRFDAPLKEAITYSFDNAARMLVESSLDKMHQAMESIYFRLGVGRNALDADTQRMKETIVEFSDDLAAIDVIHAKNEKNLGVIGKDLPKQFAVLQLEMATALQTIVDAYAEAGHLTESGKAKNFLDRLDVFGRRARREAALNKARQAAAKIEIEEVRQVLEKMPKVNVRGGIVSFGSRAEAQQAARAIRIGFGTLLTTGFASLEEAVDADIEDAREKTKTLVAESFGDRWRRIQDRVKELLKLDLPKPTVTQQKIGEADIGETTNAVNSESHRVRRETFSGAASRAAGWLVNKLGISDLFKSRADDWGYDEWTSYSLDLGAIRRLTASKIEGLNAAIEERTNDAVAELKSILNDYARRLGAKVAEIRAYLEKERVARQGDIASYEKLRKDINILADEADDLRKEAAALREAMRHG